MVNKTKEYNILIRISQGFIMMFKIYTLSHCIENSQFFVNLSHFVVIIYHQTTNSELPENRRSTYQETAKNVLRKVNNSRN